MVRLISIKKMMGISSGWRPRLQSKLIQTAKTNKKKRSMKEEKMTKMKRKRIKILRTLEFHSALKTTRRSATLRAK